MVERPGVVLVAERHVERGAGRRALRVDLDLPRTVAGPRIDPASIRVPEGLEVRAFVPELYRHLAVCDLAGEPGQRVVASIARVDGGVIDNLPVAIAALTADLLIADFASALEVTR